MASLKFRRTIGALALLSTALLSSPAAADELRWNDDWPTFRTTEGVVTGVAAASVVAFYVLPHRQAYWGRPILFDTAFRDALHSDDEKTDNRWQRWSTFGYFGMAAYPVLIDALVVPLIRGNSKVAAQMIAIDAEAFALTALIFRASETLVGRARPSVYQCSREKGGYDQCIEEGVGGTNTFISGHVSIAATGAALTCTHHYHLKLYGSPGDAIACGLGIAATAMIGVGRMVTDNHYATDVLAGAIVGTLSGWLVPTALHYGFDGHGVGHTSSIGMPVPIASSTTLGLGWLMAL